MSDATPTTKQPEFANAYEQAAAERADAILQSRNAAAELQRLEQQAVALRVRMQNAESAQELHALRGEQDDLKGRIETAKEWLALVQERERDAEAQFNKQALIMRSIDLARRINENREHFDAELEKLVEHLRAYLKQQDRAQTLWDAAQQLNRERDELAAQGVAAPVSTVTRMPLGVYVNEMVNKPGPHNVGGF